MRWDNLFDDLESQLEHELSADEFDLQAEEERLRLARISVRDRIVALQAGGGPVRVFLGGERSAELIPTGLGRDWMSAEERQDSGKRRACVVPFDAISGLQLSRGRLEASLHGETAHDPDAPSGPGLLSARLGLGSALRDLCRRRRAVELRLLTGSLLHGTIDRVGRDHLDLAVHERGEPRRSSNVLQYRIVPFAALELVAF